MTRATALLDAALTVQRSSPARRRAATGDYSVLYWPVAKVYAARVAYYMRRDGVRAKVAYYNITGRELTNICWRRVERAISHMIVAEIVRLLAEDAAERMAA